MPTSRTAITDPSDIPTLSDLWAQKELQRDDDKQVQHNDDLNKRVSIWRGIPSRFHVRQS